MPNLKNIEGRRFERLRVIKYTGYHLYGGRGITVCERWQDFKNFITDIGKRPSKKHSIDRVDNDGNYEPSNCRWTLPEIQARNTRQTVFIEFNGAKKCLSEWARDVGISLETLRYRLLKMPIEKAMTMSKRW